MENKIGYFFIVAMYFVCDWAVWQQSFFTSALFKGEGDWQKYTKLAKYNPFDPFKIVFFIVFCFSIHFTSNKDIGDNWAVAIVGAAGAPYLIYALWLAGKAFKKAYAEVEKPKK